VWNVRACAASLGVTLDDTLNARVIHEASAIVRDTVYDAKMQLLKDCEWRTGESETVALKGAVSAIAMPLAVKSHNLNEAKRLSELVDYHTSHKLKSLVYHKQLLFLHVLTRPLAAQVELKGLRAINFPPDVDVAKLTEDKPKWPDEDSQAFRLLYTCGTVVVGGGFNVLCDVLTNDPPKYAVMQGSVTGRGKGRAAVKFDAFEAELAKRARDAVSDTGRSEKDKVSAKVLLLTLYVESWRVKPKSGTAQFTNTGVTYHRSVCVFTDCPRTDGSAADDDATRMEYISDLRLLALGTQPVKSAQSFGRRMFV
jgi:hypothetical protein